MEKKKTLKYETKRYLCICLLLKLHCFMKIRFLLLSLLMLLAVMPVSAQTESASIETMDSVKVNGNMRRYRLVLPRHTDGHTPLVVLLHGYNCDIDPVTCMDSIARAEGFALCVPQGLADPTGVRGWNVGYPMQKGWQVDDVDDLCRLVRHLQRKHKLSPTDAFLTGMSNGGEMCYLMAYSNRRVFKAIGSVAGLTLVWMYKQFTPQRQVPFMEIHGTEDRVSEWTGDIDNRGGWNAYLPVPIAVGRMVALNRCTHEQVEELPARTPSNGHRVVKHSFLGGDNGCDVWLYEVVGGDHCWHTADMDTGQELWRFFKQYVGK